MRRGARGRGASGRAVGGPTAAALLVLLQTACAGPGPDQALQPSAQRSFERCPWGPAADAPRVRLADAAHELAMAREQGLGLDPALERLVLVELGTQPSGGHRLVLAPAGLQRQGGQLAVHVEHRRPAADAMVTMALTQPCLALVVPREGWTSATLHGLR